MAHGLQVGVETALGLDVGMADQIADLSLLAADFTLFAHDVLLWMPPFSGSQDTFFLSL